MFFRILKKDLKRKKTMNIILLLFVVLAAMFVASSVNNIITVTNGLDYYFKTAEFDCDYVALAVDKKDKESIVDVLPAMSSVKSFRSEQHYLGDATTLRKNGEKAIEFSGSALFLPIERAQINYFNKDNEKIKTVNEGEIYVPQSMVSTEKIQIGDTYEFVCKDVKFPVKVIGYFKDAPMGSPFMGLPRFLFSEADYQKIDGNSIQGVYIKTDDVEALQEALGDYSGILFQGSIELIRTTYVLDMIIAYILLVLCVGLILISFVMLRFTIGFTLREEFREIGVMKAIGLKNRKIRMLYMTKYFAISLLGAVIGFAASIPFGNMLLKSASENMVLGNNHSMMIGMLCAAVVVVVIMLFCYFCTGKIKKLSPVDAVRCGQTGERFRKKRGLRLENHKLGPTGFLAVNDVLSNPKQFSIITVILTLCLSMVLIMANLSNTLCSERLIHLFGMPKTDVYFTDERIDKKTGWNTVFDEEDKDNNFSNRMKEIEQILAENGIPAKVSTQVQFFFKLSFNGKSAGVTFQQSRGTDQCGFRCYEGSTPQKADEIALAPQIADMFGAKIGDTVQINIDGENKDFIVTGIFSSMNNTGKIAYLHQDAPVKDKDITGFFYYQADFTDHPDKAEVSRRFDKIAEIFQSSDVMDAGETTKKTTNCADAIRAVQYMLLLVTLILTALIVIMIERSFISKETGEIALMKALGIKSGRIIRQHTLRFVIAALVSVLLAVALCVPLTNLCITPIFSLMGNSSSISYLIRPLEVFVIYPAALLLTTALSAWLTALYTKTVKASQTANIE